jgi:hypothetical protein
MRDMLKDFVARGSPFDWVKDITRLTREIGEIKMGLEPYELALWERIWKKKKKNKEIEKESMRFLDSLG